MRKQMALFGLDLLARARALLNKCLAGDPPEEPLTAVREPRWKRPGGRSSSIAMAEPEPDECVTANGVQSTRRAPNVDTC